MTKSLILVVLLFGFSTQGFAKTAAKKRAMASAQDAFLKIADGSLRSKAVSCEESIDLMVEVSRFGQAERKLLNDKFGAAAFSSFDGSRVMITTPIGQLQELVKFDFVGKVYENSISGPM